MKVHTLSDLEFAQIRRKVNASVLSDDAKLIGSLDTLAQRFHVDVWLNSALPEMAFIQVTRCLFLMAAHAIPEGRPKVAVPWKQILILGHALGILAKQCLHSGLKRRHISLGGRFKVFEP